jgi:hypothetical protein
MPDTIPCPPRLRLARPGDTPPAKPVLRPLARLDVEQARQFLMELDGLTRGADLSVAMFLLGRLAEHAQALLDVLDATVTL